MDLYDSFSPAGKIYTFDFIYFIRLSIKHELKATGPPVGLMPDSIFKTEQIHLDLGDLLLGYTDGVAEARSPMDEVFTRNRLRGLLSQQYNSAFELLELIRTTLFSFIDAAPRWDDVTMLAVQRITP